MIRIPSPGDDCTAGVCLMAAAAGSGLAAGACAASAFWHARRHWVCIKAELVRHSPAAAHSAQAWSGRGPLGADADFTGSISPAARICSGIAMMAHSMVKTIDQCFLLPN
jgi:hypothetical protein